jgi:hypothetical protein
MLIDSLWGVQEDPGGEILKESEAGIGRMQAVE